MTDHQIHIHDIHRHVKAHSFFWYSWETRDAETPVHVHVNPELTGSVCGTHQQTRPLFHSVSVILSSACHRSTQTAHIKAGKNRTRHRCHWIALTGLWEPFWHTYYALNYTAVVSNPGLSNGVFFSTFKSRFTAHWSRFILASRNWTEGSQLCRGKHPNDPCQPVCVYMNKEHRSIGTNSAAGTHLYLFHLRKSLHIA